MTLATNIATLVTSPVSALISIKSAQPLTDNTVIVPVISPSKLLLNTKPLLTITATGINTNNIVKQPKSLQPLTDNTVTIKTITIPRLTLNPNISLGGTINQTVSVMNGTVTIKQSLIAYWS